MNYNRTVDILLITKMLQLQQKEYYLNTNYSIIDYQVKTVKTRSTNNKCTLKIAIIKRYKKINMNKI